MTTGLGSASIEEMLAKVILMQGYGPAVTKPIHTLGHALDHNRKSRDCREVSG
jgi:hypothetical protein